MGKIIAVCGKICCGKTWYVRKLVQTHKAVVLSTDELTYDLIDNVQGEFYDQFCVRALKYLDKKAAEIAEAGCDVILDRGFWQRSSRRALNEYFTACGIEVEWHYIKISDEDWERNIAERNARILAGNGGSDFYLDDGLRAKLLSLWEKPEPSEIDVLYTFKRDE